MYVRAVVCQGWVVFEALGFGVGAVGELVNPGVVACIVGAAGAAGVVGVPGAAGVVGTGVFCGLQLVQRPAPTVDSVARFVAVVFGVGVGVGMIVSVVD